MSTSTRVLKNTWYLYFRMGITVFIGLYSTRLILGSLGASDFGIFNVVGGSIAMLGFLNSTLANATQRFISYAEGKGDDHNKRKIFNVSCVLQIFIAVLTVIMLTCIQPLLFNHLLNIETSRLQSAHIIYYCLMFSTFLSIINVPYEAVLTAHENMRYYFVLGIIESILRLGIAFACVYYYGDKLVLYGILMAIVPLLTLSIMKIYCHRKYDECTLNLKKYWDFEIVKSIGAFSSWNFFTAITSLVTVQGLGIALNHFFGSIANAAQGIANQVNAQLSSFSSNMMKALNPVIVKTTAKSDPQSINLITITGCKISTLLIILFAVPAIIEMPYVLKLWLTEVPDWTVLFCRLQLVYTIIVQISNPAATAVYGAGDIKYYAIYKSLMNILPLFLTTLFFFFGGNPLWLYIPLIVIGGICGDIVVAYYAHKQCGLDLNCYIKNAIIPVAGITILMTITGGSFVYLSHQNLITLITCCLVTTVTLVLSLYFFGLTIEETVIVNRLKGKIVNLMKNLF